MSEDTSAKARLIALAEQAGLRLYGPMERKTQITEDGTYLVTTKPRALSYTGKKVLEFARLVEEEACQRVRTSLFPEETWRGQHRYTTHFSEIQEAILGAQMVPSDPPQEVKT